MQVKSTGVFSVEITVTPHELSAINKLRDVMCKHQFHLLPDFFKAILEPTQTQIDNAIDVLEIGKCFDTPKPGKPGKVVR